jgi:hypothetical protein
MIWGGLYRGVYVPADASIRSKLDPSRLIRFNVINMRWLAVFQFTACGFIFLVLKNGELPRLTLCIAVLVTVTTAYGIWEYHKAAFLGVPSRDE